MWKFVTRGIRETLERRVCRTNVCTQTSQDNNAKSEVKQSLTCNHKFLAPNFCCNNKDFWQSAKTGGAKDNGDGTKWNAKHTWTEAVGWSSVIAVGWVVCQSLCIHRKLFDKEQNELTETLTTKICRIIGCPQSETRYISSLLSQVLSLKAQYVLPITNCAGNKNEKVIRDSREYTSDRPFGPTTVEEALKEATDEFARVHKLVMGEYELFFGIQALEEKRYSDAVEHFTAGANLSSPASMFNLGICHELGLGTLTDPTKAAKYYSDAAEYGHADAIYNLGVFHAQGKGGFRINIDTARDYFIKAAELGQAQAQHALDLEKKSVHMKENANTTVYQNTCNRSLNNVYCNNVNNTINNVLMKVASNDDASSKYLDIIPTSKKPNYVQRVDEFMNPTEMFLSLLGIRESSTVAVPVGPDYNVPY